MPSLGTMNQAWPSTHSSLLIRLRDAGDNEAWTEFVDAYAPVVYQYARKRGLQDADAADLTQEVLRGVVRAIRDFQYDRRRGTFRGWLFTLTRNKVNSFWRSAMRRERARGDTDARRMLEQQAAPEGEGRDQWDEEYERRLLAWAARRVRAAFAPSTWEAFWRTAVLAEAPRAVARRLGMSIGAVYVAKSRVVARIRREVAQLEQG